MRQIATAVCRDLGVNRTGEDGIGGTSRSAALIVARAMIASIGRHYGYTHESICPEAGYESHASSIAGANAIESGKYDGRVPAIKSAKFKVATIIAKLEETD